MKSQLIVPSNLSYIRLVERWFLEFVEVNLQQSFDWQQHSNHLRLALAEAFSNVVIHAHQQQADLPIKLQLEIADHKIILKIWDLGKGFDPLTYQPPQPTEYREGGYGWMIINQIMDQVDYLTLSDGSNCLCLQFNLSQAHRTLTNV